MKDISKIISNINNIINPGYSLIHIKDEDELFYFINEIPNEMVIFNLIQVKNPHTQYGNIYIQTMDDCYGNLITRFDILCITDNGSINIPAFRVALNKIANNINKCIPDCNLTFMVSVFDNRHTLTTKDNNEIYCTLLEFLNLKSDSSVFITSQCQVDKFFKVSSTNKYKRKKKSKKSKNKKHKKK